MRSAGHNDRPELLSARPLTGDRVESTVEKRSDISVEGVIDSVADMGGQTARQLIPSPPMGRGDSGARSFTVEIKDAFLIPKLDGYHAAVPLGLHERAVIDLVRRELQRLAIDLRDA